MRRLLVIFACILLAADMPSATRLLMAARGSGGFTITTPAAFAIQSAPEGGGVWFGGPRALRNGSSTIVGYDIGTSGGDVKAAIIDNTSHAVLSTATLYDSFQVDDHDPPSFVVRPDGIIMAAFAYHVGEIYVGIGPSAGVLPAQANVTNITSQVGSLSGSAGYTYASILYLESESRYYIFFRYHDPSSVPYVGYTYSDDDGATWAARTLVQQITYHRVVKNGTDRLDLVLSDHPLYGQGDNAAVHTSIYHSYYESGSWHGTNGGSLGSLPIGNTAATLVYDGATSRAWLWDIAIDGTGTPVIVYVTYDETFPSGAWHYEYARWTGSAWSTHIVADAGTAIAPTATPEHGNNYAGGIVLDQSNPSVVWYSTDAIGGQFQIYRAVTSDSGATWTSTAITSDSAKNVRPSTVFGADPHLQVIWWSGTYTDYFNYSQGMVGAGI
jgi:hypothetical protein